MQKAYNFLLEKAGLDNVEVTEAFKRAGVSHSGARAQAVSGATASEPVIECSLMQQPGPDPVIHQKIPPPSSKKRGATISTILSTHAHNVIL